MALKFQGGYIGGLTAPLNGLFGSDGYRSTLNNAIAIHSVSCEWSLNNDSETPVGNTQMQERTFGIFHYQIFTALTPNAFPWCHKHCSTSVDLLTHSNISYPAHSPYKTTPCTLPSNHPLIYNTAVTQTRCPSWPEQDATERGR